MHFDWQPILLSLELSLITTLVLAVAGVPLGYWLAQTTIPAKPFLEALFSLPLVLPPSVLGFYLLLAFSPGNAWGRFLNERLGLHVLFSFEGLVIASVIYSIPFMVHPVQAGFRNLSPSLKEASYTLGASPLRTFFRVMLPNIKPALLSAIVLTFAHTMGEFGVVMMIGGNIPGLTRVASIAVYDEVESLHYESAHIYAALLLVLSFILLSVLFLVNKKMFIKTGKNV